MNQKLKENVGRASGRDQRRPSNEDGQEAAGKWNQRLGGTLRPGSSSSNPRRKPRRERKKSDKAKCKHDIRRGGWGERDRRGRQSLRPWFTRKIFKFPGIPTLLPTYCGPWARCSACLVLNFPYLWNEAPQGCSWIFFKKRQSLLNSFLLCCRFSIHCSIKITSKSHETLKAQAQLFFWKAATETHEAKLKSCERSGYVTALITPEVQLERAFSNHLLYSLFCKQDTWAQRDSASPQN